MDTIIAQKILPWFVIGSLLGTLHNLAANPAPILSPAPVVKVETLQFATVDQLHKHNLHAFEQVRDAFGFSRIIKVYRNPMHQQNLIVGNQKVKSISLVSNALSKSLNVNTLELQKIPKSFNYPSQSHPSFQVSFATGQQQQQVYQSLSPKKPMIKDGTKVWAAMFAKQQCLKWHETYKLGSVIGALCMNWRSLNPSRKMIIL